MTPKSNKYIDSDVVNFTVESVDAAPFSYQNTGSKRIFDARSFVGSVSEETTYPIKLGNNVSGSEWLWVGGDIDCNMTGDHPWVYYKTGHHDTALLFQPAVWGVVDGFVAKNCMDGVRINKHINFSLRNAYLQNCHDDAIENDKNAGGEIHDCLIDGCYVFLSTRGEPWQSSNESLKISRCLVRQKPFEYTVDEGENPPASGSIVNGKGHSQLFKTDENMLPLEVTDCVFWVPQVSVDGINSMDFVGEGSKTGAQTHIWKNNILFWNGTGDYPAALPASGVTVIQTDYETTSEIWSGLASNWMYRHGLDIEDKELLIDPKPFFLE